MRCCGPHKLHRSLKITIQFQSNVVFANSQSDSQGPAF